MTDEQQQQDAGDIGGADEDIGDGGETGEQLLTTGETDEGWVYPTLGTIEAREGQGDVTRWGEGDSAEERDDR